MHSVNLIATSLFAAGALAGNLHQLLPRELQVRQDQSFTPTTNFGQGATCADAFGPGYVDCNGVCYNPGEGETCCAGNGDAYPCPNDSFCLINGLCCPDGLPAETCAAQNGVTLPQGFSTNTAASVGATTAAQTPKPTVSVIESSASESSVFVPSTTAVVTTPIPLPSPVPDTTPVPLPSPVYPIPGNGTVPGVPAPTGTGAGSAPVTPFTGAAASVRGYCGGVVAALAGVVGLLL
ncbi:MAG: hypothetical protein LQ346_008373 [Caloplaca aetnensis]|nr:MAG: hypothetical protein LQ346_008373 [Caloplaca aetnensis]